MKNINRRSFLEFLGLGTVSLLTTGFVPKTPPSSLHFGKLKSLSASSADRLELAKGLRYEMLVKWDDLISPTDRFGFNNDYLAFLPFDKNNPDDGLLWVNHEYVDPQFVSGFLEYTNTSKTKEQVEKEMYAVGGSVLRLQKVNDKWQVVFNDTFNRRITGMTEIPFNWPEPIAGAHSAIGTLGNCAGGVTPWGTILTCEENYDMFYGERDFKTGQRIAKDSDLGWYRYYDYPPEHYGWVVEVNLHTGAAQKHIALGRCAHECATVKELPDGRIVVYMGDDANNQCLYKFISSKPGSLSEGKLYVANVNFGQWISLDYDEHPTLQAKFENQTEVLIRLREASRFVGGSALDRPEDIEIDPITGNVLIALTNNLAKAEKNYLGSILKISETDGRHDSLTFTAETYLTGGEETGFACPDNLAFDAQGNLWFTSDMSGSAMNNEKFPAYLPFKNNSLFLVPRTGEKAGQVIRMANAPTDAEFTGPFFSPDGKTLFLSVQHPGEYSVLPNRQTSDWPDGRGAMPRPGVIAVYGI